MKIKMKRKRVGMGESFPKPKDKYGPRLEWWKVERGRREECWKGDRS